MGPENVLKMAHWRIYGAVHLLYAGFIVILLAGTTQAKIGYFWHITDLHLDTFYSTQGDIMKSCWHIEHHQASPSGRTPGRFGDYLCDSPWSLLESATLAMKSKQGDNVEFVLWTGDGLSRSAHRLQETYRLDILRNITDLLGRTFPSQFVFPVLGHEDGSNTNFRRLGELWRHWLPSEALQTFEKGGYYTIEQTKSRLRIIALNTNFMRHDPKYIPGQSAAVRQRQSNQMGNMGGSVDSTEYKNFYYHHASGHHYHSDSTGYGHSGGSHYGTAGGQVSALSGYDNHDSQKQWDWLEEVLAKSNRNKETVYIVGHIPPGSDERIFGSQQNGHTTFSDKNNVRYLKLVRKYSSIIQGQFFGHLHSDSFRIIYNDMGKPVSWIMISPSVTPRKMNVGSNNPAMRLYKFDTDSGQVLDYTQYYLDLSLANREGEANWLPEYNLTTFYFGLGEISAISLHNLAERFTSTDSPSFLKYYRANSVRFVTQQCEAACFLNHFCAITRIDYREIRQCLESAALALGSNHAPSVALCPPSTILLLTSILLTIKMSKKLLLSQINSVTQGIRQMSVAAIRRGRRHSSKNGAIVSIYKCMQLCCCRPASRTLFSELLQLALCSILNLFFYIERKLRCSLRTLRKFVFHKRCTTTTTPNPSNSVHIKEAICQTYVVVNVVSDKIQIILSNKIYSRIFLSAVFCICVAFVSVCRISV